MSPYRFVPAVAALLFAVSTRPVPSAQRAAGRPPGERADVIVAQDGSGDFRAIQPALDAIPKDNASNRIILVRNGIYREKLYVTASHVSSSKGPREAASA